MKKNVFLLICMCCVFILSQCSDNDSNDVEKPVNPEDTEDSFYTFTPFNPIDPIVPIKPFEYSSVAFIARITENSGEWSLCTVDKEGNNMRKIVDKTLTCQKPVCSYSGTKLLFSAIKADYNNYSYEYELYIVNVDGTGLTLIDRISSKESGYFGGADWFPDDSRIAYVRSYDDSWDKTRLILYKIADDTHTILPTEGNVCNPDFSPDGTKIAYCSSDETLYSIDVLGINENIYIMDINENKNQLIIENGASPKWSPSGEKIMYRTSGKDRSSQISVANADGTDQKQLTSTVSTEWWDTGFPRDGNSDPQWTPDGKKIVYVSYENDKPEIFIMDADGSNQTRLTEAGYRDESPIVTPDDKHIIFNSRLSGISIMTLDGKNREVILTEDAAYPVACK